MSTRGGFSAIPLTMPRSVIVSTGISGSGTVSRMAMIAALSSIFSPTPPMDSILHPFERQRDSLADADTHGRKRELAATALKLLGRGESEARARHAERVAKRDRATVGVHLRRVVGNAELAENGESLRREGLVQFDHVEVPDLEAEALHQLFGSGRGADAHDSRRNPGHRSAEHAGLGREAVAPGRFLRRDDDRRRAVVHARRISGGDGAV